MGLLGVLDVNMEKQTVHVLGRSSLPWGLVHAKDCEEKSKGFIIMSHNKWYRLIVVLMMLVFDIHLKLNASLLTCIKTNCDIII